MGLPKVSVINERTPCVVLLVSKSHAHLLNDGEDFCACLLAHSVDALAGHQIDLLAAVVDGVSFPQGSVGQGEGDLPNLDRSRSFEGISVLVSRTEEIAPRLWSTSRILNHQRPSNMQQHSTLAFEFQYRISDIKSMAHSQDTQLQTSRVVKMPLANTLFQNGHTSTLYAQRWVMRMASEYKPEMLRTKHVRLSQEVLQMAELTKACDQMDFYNLETKLVPITPPRSVDASFGNIVRRLRVEDLNGTQISVPASTELEARISQWVQTRHHSNPQVQVWALVTPRLNSLDSARLEPHDLQASLENGSRLHKVLSGGGGWGTKKGLLALDPDSDYDATCDNPPQNRAVDVETVGKDERQAFHEIAEPGDIVTFYVYDAELPKPLSKRPWPSQQNRWDVRSNPSVVLGTAIPSIDANTKDSDMAEVDYIFAMHHFGMVSEQGMALNIASLRGRQIPSLSAEQVSTSVQTKLDAPCTRFSTGGTFPYIAKRTIA